MILTFRGRTSDETALGSRGKTKGRPPEEKKRPKGVFEKRGVMNLWFLTKDEKPPKKEKVASSRKNIPSSWYLFGGIRNVKVSPGVCEQKAGGRTESNSLQEGPKAFRGA